MLDEQTNQRAEDGGEVGMTKREKVIKILECCIEDDCEHCPITYKGGLCVARCGRMPCSVRIPLSVVRETIEVLKEEQTTVTTSWVCHLYRCGTKRYECSWCHGISRKPSDYCPDCGTRMAKVVNMDD